MHRARRRGGRSRSRRCTRSPTGATPCRPRRRVRRRARALAARTRGRHRRPSAAATTRWTATGAGTGPSSPTTRSSTPRRSRADGAAEAVEAAYERGETDEFIQPDVIGDYDGCADGDVVDPLQLPPRPHPPDRDGAGRARLRGVRPRRRAGDRAHDDDLVPDGVDLPGRVRAARPEATLAEVLSRAGSASCTSPRPRSTPTSPTSSTAGGSRSTRERSAAWSTRPGTCRRTTTARDERQAAAGSSASAGAAGGLPVRDHQLRQPRHGRAHRQRPCGGKRDRGRRRCLGEVVRPCTSPAAPAS